MLPLRRSCESCLAEACARWWWGLFTEGTRAAAENSTTTLPGPEWSIATGAGCAAVEKKEPCGGRNVYGKEGSPEPAHTKNLCAPSALVRTGAYRSRG